MQRIVEACRRHFSRLAPQPISRVVPVADAVSFLTSAEGQGVHDDLFRFGSLLLSESLSRSSALDSKATSILGWSGAALAFLIVGTPMWTSTNSWLVVVLSIITMACAGTAAVRAVQALRLRGWHWMSQLDWFQHGVFVDAVTLRACHVRSMLTTHTDHLRILSEKSRLLVQAQNALVVAIGVLGLMAVVRVFALFVGSLFL
jgi:hypothetical protein